MTAQLDGFALDLGGTKIAAARIAGGQIIARAAGPTSAQDDAAAQITVMAGLAARVGYQPGAPLGVAVAGRIDAAGRWQAVNTDTLGSIGAVPIARLIEAALGPAACLNDAAAAALAEARLGAGRGLDNFAFLTVSTGVGGGLVLGGRLLSSVTGLAGHVGFTTTPYDQGFSGVVVVRRVICGYYFDLVGYKLHTPLDRVTHREGMRGTTLGSLA